jgi:molybdenum cofactor cytidylyltransferase
MIQTPFTTLSQALRLDTSTKKPLIALVGGGGKTTALFALAEELSAQGKRVVITTTTRLYGTQGQQSRAWCGWDEIERLGALLDEHGYCLVTATRSTEDNGKIEGITLEQVAELYARADVDGIVNEADGSRKRPFKAPAPYEPVIPSATTHVVAIVGADVFGKPIDAEHVHRPERIVAIAGVQAGDTVTPDIVARVLTHPEGGFFHLPPTADFIPLLNKAEDTADAMQAEMTARLLLEHERVKEVVIGSLQQRQLQRWGRTAGVVLAAGMATRFGATKQLLPWRAGTLVGYVTERLVEVCESVLVVVGHEAEAVAEAVAHLPVEVIYNSDYMSGQGSSVAAGAKALLEANRPFHSEVFFAVADHPFLETSLLTDLQAVRRDHKIAIPRYNNQRGNPVLFDSVLLPELTTLTGDSGGRTIFGTYQDDIAWVDVSDEKALMDIDTAQTWEGIQDGDS